MPNVLSSRRTPGSPPASNSHPIKVDFLLHPSAIRTAPPLISSPSSSKLASLDSYVQDILTVPASLAGLPAISVPAGLAEDGWPVGVSVVGQWGCDDGVLRIGRVIENSVKQREGG
jgi:aspartyl-tRNA(Asn)/glutamyl-tRNA(Gln) amidotransferase subunit A